MYETGYFLFRIIRKRCADNQRLFQGTRMMVREKLIDNLSMFKNRYKNLKYKNKLNNNHCVCHH